MYCHPKAVKKWAKAMKPEATRNSLNKPASCVPRVLQNATSSIVNKPSSARRLRRLALPFPRLR